jgi:60 kDa SS-A/Ro ribonucleoprotein
MANQHLFRSAARRIAIADAVNEAGGKAYTRPARQALAQYAATGCFGTTFYASQGEQLDRVLALCAELDDDFIARTAVYARQRAHMKDVPALLLAVLANRGSDRLDRVFDRVCDNGKLLRGFVQIVRSGVTGRRSLGTRPKRLVQQWLARKSDAAILRASVGNEPSLADVIKMVHPTPQTASRRALYGWLVGRPHDPQALPELVKAFEAYKTGASTEVPDVPFQLLTSLPLDAAAWRRIARHAPWQMTRMNLATFARHGVFEHPELVRVVAERLRDPAQIRQAKAFPYQLMVAHAHTGTDVPAEIRGALHDAMEHAVANVPCVRGPVYVLPDVSGSMQSPVTGRRKGATSVVRCIDVAALVAAAILRSNPNRATVLPFHDRVERCALEPKDSIMTNAKLLAALPSGGTDCSAPLRELNRRKATGDLVVFVSDNQSWIDRSRSFDPGTNVLAQWEEYRRRNPRAKLVCIDVQPGTTTQAPDRPDILNVGGFSDAVFELLGLFVADQLHPDHWVHEIESVTL